MERASHILKFTCVQFLSEMEAGKLGHRDTELSKCGSLSILKVNLRADRFVASASVKRHEHGGVPNSRPRPTD